MKNIFKKYINKKITFPVLSHISLGILEIESKRDLTETEVKLTEFTATVVSELPTSCSLIVFFALNKLRIVGLFIIYIKVN